MDQDLVSGVDYTQSEGLQRKRILKFVNHYIVQMTNFLSNFSQSCDIRLLNLTNKLRHLETSLVLLESKLDSLPQLNSLPAPAPVKEIAKREEELEAVSEKKDKQDAKLERFSKMISVGVPVYAVRQKMASDGYEEDLIAAFMSQQIN